MIVRTIAQITGTERDVKSGNWRSKRLILAEDGLGFSLHETVLDANTENDFWYANHVEAVLIIEGEGELYDKDSGVTHALRPGTMYALNGNENHHVRSFTKIRSVCIFNPALVGPEVHDESGSYPLAKM